MGTGHEMCLQDRRGWRGAIKAHKNGSTLRLIGKGLSLITDTLCLCVCVRTRGPEVAGVGARLVTRHTPMYLRQLLCWWMPL